MNTDMDLFLTLKYSFNLYIGMLIKCCKKNDSLSAENVVVLGFLAYHLCLPSTFLVHICT